MLIAPIRFEPVVVQAPVVVVAATVRRLYWSPDIVTVQ